MNTDLILQLLPLLNFLILPFVRSLWKFHKRLVTLEVNQRIICEKLAVKRQEL